MNTNTITKLILDAHNENGGATFIIDGTNCAGQDAYAVSVYKNREKLVCATLTEDHIKAFIRDNWDILAEDVAIGTWTDAETGYNYLDVVRLEPSRELALKLGEDHQQKAIFHLKTREVINL